MENTTISANDFITVWKDFIDSKMKEKKWEEAWNTNNDWSKFVLKTKSSTSKDSPIGDAISARWPFLGYRTEDGSIDLSFFIHEQSSFNFQKLGSNWEFEELEKKGYPCFYPILLEHENDIYSSYHEVAKLTYYRARLKVLVTYHSGDNLTPDKRKKEIDMLKENFRRFLSQSHRFFPENQLVEYLLIVGGMVKGALAWTYVTFDTQGNVKREVSDYSK